ncbi:MAG: HAD family hydrolase [Erysipelotrichaceae bacterium]
MIRACAFDLDGTIIVRNKILLGDRLKKILKKLREKGIYSIVITSRSLDEMKNMEEGFYDHFDALVVSTGSLIFKGNTLVKKHLISYKDIEKSLEFFEKNDILCAYSHEDGIFYYSHEIPEDKKHHFQHIFTNGFQVKPYEKGRDFLDFVYNMDFHYNQFKYINIPHNENIEVVPFLRHGHIKPRGINKGTGLKDVAKVMGINSDEIMVFGDNVNDISMFIEAKYAIAVENAKEELKEFATDICGKVSEDGVAKYLEKLEKEGKL